MEVKKRIAVLGAGIYNLPVFEHLNNAGYYTIAVDGNENAPAKDIANEFLHVNFVDKVSLAKALKNANIQAILPLNDWGTLSAAYVNKELKLLGISEQAALAATDKGIMRDTWQANHIPNPAYFVFTNLEQLKLNINKVGYPCVIKPTDSGGSGRGISILKNKEDIEWAYNFAKPFVRNNRFICEAFIEGVELTVETISINGKAHVLAVSDKEKPDLKTRVAMSLNYPAKLTDMQKKTVYEIAQKAVEALGIHIGMAHTELIINNNSITMVETGARGGGGHIFHSIIQAVSGVNAPVIVADLLCGKNVELPIIKEFGCVYRFFNVPKGVLKQVIGLEKVKEFASVLDIGMIKQIGDTVGDLKNSLERAGHVITTGKTRNEAIKNANDAEANLAFIIDQIKE